LRRKAKKDRRKFCGLKNRAKEEEGAQIEKVLFDQFRMQQKHDRFRNAFI